MKNKKITQSLILLAALISIFTLSECNIEYHASSDSCLKNLDGLWKFSIGDDMEWANPEFNDSAWDEIHVPTSWEQDGYVGYDGFAWYRTKISIPSYLCDEVLFLELAQIDDVDETYFNGHKIGGLGTFPPNAKTAYNVDRHYYIPKEFLNKNGDNYIAVRVYDQQQVGGIVNGQVGICTYRDLPEMLVSLEGKWKFSTYDNPAWSKTDYDDSEWKSINVPNTWESQGYEGYDGFGWYRLQFRAPSVKDDDLVLMLGCIDDIDQVFVNGKMIGSTGEFGKRIWTKNSFFWDKDWLELRGYEIPKGLLNRGGKNVIAVRVFDQGGSGGIYEGPLGILSLKEFKKYKRKHEQYVDSDLYHFTKRIVINTFKY